MEVTLSTSPTVEDAEELKLLDSLFAHYHRQLWYQQWMFFGFRRKNVLCNGLALLSIAVGMIVSALWIESAAVICLTAFSTMVKGWMDFRKYPQKMEMCRVAYTSFEKMINQLRAYAHTSAAEDLSAFVSESKVVEDFVTDLTPPITQELIQRYERDFKVVPSVKKATGVMTTSFESCPQCADDV